jgi:demethylmenaquinone methyltransferase / 2-methoxy-6-polyprenyl-1,4-benzoquinol methylase
VSTPQRDPEAVRRMFSGIAPRYDRGNTLMTLGLDGLWRSRVVAQCGLRPGDRAVDLACGTAEIALRLKRRVGPGGAVCAVDFSAPMLEVARRKAAHRGLSLDLIQADILRLPLPDGGFDAATIGFGVRNVSDPPACLGELARVVRPGGRVVILETGQPAAAAARWLLAGPGRWWMRLTGGLGSGDVAGYDYLHRTTLNFPSGEQFTALMRASGAYSAVRAWPQLLGAVWIYSGVVA